MKLRFSKMVTYLTRLSSSRNLLYIVVKSPLKITCQKETTSTENIKEKETNRAQKK